MGSGVVYFQVASRTPGVPQGLQWRIWGQKTDFYLKPRIRFLDEFKVSIHGPNERHDGWGLRFDLDGKTRELRRRENRARPAVNREPITFPGGPAQDGLIHVVRIAAPHDMFTSGAPSAATPPPIKEHQQAGLLSVPGPGCYTCVDLYLAAPAWWEGRQGLRGRSGVLGPIVNDTGHYLLGSVQRMEEVLHPIPPVLRSFDAQPGQKASRSVTETIDEEGFVWLCERPVAWPPPEPAVID